MTLPNPWIDVDAFIEAVDSGTPPTSVELAAVLGPQWESLIELFRAAQQLSASDVSGLLSAFSGVSLPDWDSAADSVYLLRSRGVEVANTPGMHERPDPCLGAALALFVRDLIGNQFTQADYDLLTHPWATSVGKVHPDD